MTARRAAVGIVALLFLALIGTGVVLINRGASMPAVTGALFGVGLGGLGLCVEAFSLSWALRRKLAWTLGVSLGGFLARLVLVVVPRSLTECETLMESIVSTVSPLAFESRS